MIFIYTTCADKKEAQKIARAIVRGRLAACINIWPIDYCYLWKGKMGEGKEMAMVLKTAEKNFGKIEKMIKKMHSYDVPCIAGWKIDKVNKDFGSWVESALEPTL